MPMLISSEDRRKIEELLQKEMVDDVGVTVLTQPVPRLIISGQPQRAYQETEQLLRELGELSPKIKLEVIDASQHSEGLKEYDIDKLPAIVVAADGQRNLRFFGFPGGYEFSNLLHSLICASKKESGLPKELEEEVSRLDKPVHLQVFVTPT